MEEVPSDLYLSVDNEHMGLEKVILGKENNKAIYAKRHM